MTCLCLFFDLQAKRKNSCFINTIYIMSPAKTKGLLLITHDLGVISCQFVDMAPLPKKRRKNSQHFFFFK